MQYLKKLASIILITCYGMALYADNPPHLTHAQETEQLAELKHVLVSISNQTQKLRLVVAALIQKSDPSFLKQVDHAAVRAWAFNIQQFLKDIHDMPAPSEYHMLIKAHANLYCAQLLTTALSSNLHTLPLCSPEQAVQQMRNPDMAQIFITEHATQQLIQQLEPTVKNLGLSWNNRMVRSVEVFWKEHKFSSRLPWVALLGTIGCSARWILDSTIHTDAEGINYTNKDTVQKVLGEFGGHYSAQFAANLAIAAIGYSSGKFSAAQQVLQDKAVAYWNSLKGIDTVLDASGFQAIDDTAITFQSDELIGLEEQKRDVQPILDCCADLDDFVRRGNKPQYGTLLIGPSGCGKTLFSHALAGTMYQICKLTGSATKVTFKEISCIDLKMKSLRGFIQDARQEGGVVVLFIDEIHNLAMQTTKDAITLNDFLTQMADLYNTDVPNSYVFLIAATNQPELLGTSLLVPGRFGKIIRFSYPNSQKRAELLTTLLLRAGINPGDIDIATLVRQTGDGVSFSKLRSIINEARIKAEGAHELLGQKHLQDALDTLIHRFKHTSELLPAEQQVIAVYQASKALTYVLLNSNVQVERVTLAGVNHAVQERNEYGHIEKLDPNKNHLYTPQYGTIIFHRTQENIDLDDTVEQAKQCKALLAGSCGQRLLLQTHCTSYAATDTQQALHLAQEIILSGKKFDDLSERRRNEVKDAAEALLATYEKEVTTLLAAHKPALEKLISKLVMEITISGSDVRSALR